MLRCCYIKLVSYIYFNSNEIYIRTDIVTKKKKLFKNQYLANKWNDY